MLRRISCLMMFLISAGSALAHTPPCAQDAKDPLTVSRDWWGAFATGAVEQLEERTASSFSWTASVGWTYDRAAMLAKAAGHGPGVAFEWKEGTVRIASPSVAIVTNRLIETVRTTPPATYRYLAVLECSEGRWRVAAAQSTREAERSVRVPDANRALDDFAGDYRAPAGVLQIRVDGSALALTDPNGRSTRLESVGTDLFEMAEVAGAGVIRFVFHRGTNGRVVSMSRIALTITTFPRVDVALHPPAGDHHEDTETRRKPKP